MRLAFSTTAQILSESNTPGFALQVLGAFNGAVLNSATQPICRTPMSFRTTRVSFAASIRGGSACGCECYRSQLVAAEFWRDIHLQWWVGPELGTPTHACAQTSSGQP